MTNLTSDLVNFDYLASGRSAHPDEVTYNCFFFFDVKRHTLNKVSRSRALQRLWLNEHMLCSSMANQTRRQGKGSVWEKLNTTYHTSSIRIPLGRDTALNVGASAPNLRQFMSNQRVSANAIEEQRFLSRDFGALKIPEFNRQMQKNRFRTSWPMS